MTPLHFRNPIIVEALHVFGGIDTVTSPRANGFTEDFVYGTPFPKGYAAGYRSEDLSVILHVDHPFAPEDKTQDSLELVRNKFQFSAGGFTSVAWPPESAEGVSWQDMRPKQFGGGGPGGFAVVMDDLNVPIHANARCRISITIPSPNVIGNAWGSDPQEATYWSVVLTCLEEVS